MTPRRLVIDASVAVKWLLPEEGSEQAITLLEAGHDLHVPDLLTSEIGNVLWKKSRRDGLSDATVRRLLTEFLDIRLHWVDSRRLAADALAIARRFDRSFYDSLYLALAHAIDGTLVTTDVRFLNALADTPHAARVSALNAVNLSGRAKQSP